MNLIDYKAMLESGISPEAIHLMHGMSYTCSYCEKEHIEDVFNTGAKADE